jgi:DNA-3-methyladenine glycosylase II
MVHGNAARACLKRLCERTGATYSAAKQVPPAVLVSALSHTDIRACGFSENKTKAIVELTQKVVSGALPNTTLLKKMTDEEIIKTLIPLRGIGQWTVEMYLIFSLGRPDIFPVDDFGVREGYRVWKKEKKQRTPKQLRRLAKKWSPHRSLMARIFWQVADKAKQ